MEQWEAGLVGGARELSVARLWVWPASEAGPVLGRGRFWTGLGSEMNLVGGGTWARDRT